MCNISEGVVEKWFRKGFEIGKKRAAIQSILNVMKNLSFTFDQAVTVLDIPDNEREEYRKLVEAQSN